MAGCTDARIYHHGYIGLFDNDTEEVSGLQSFIGPDRCSERHDGSGTRFFQVLAKSRVGLAIRKYHEAKFYQLFCGFQCLDAVRQEILRVGVNF